MSGEELYIGVDVGTQGTKGLLLDVRTGAVRARAERCYGLLSGLPAGAAEQHPDTWITAVREVIDGLLSVPDVSLSQIAGIGVSGQQHGLVVLDDDDEVIRPAKLWCDTTTAAEARELSEALGRSVPAGFTAPKILWMKRHEPGAWQRARSVLLPHDYVNFWLTGRKSMEPGDASGTGIFDPVRRCFDEEAVKLVDPRLGEMLPPLIESGMPAGVLSSRRAALLGLPEGILVASGGGDNMMSAIGSGATRPGVLVVSLGTSGTAFCYSPTPMLDPNGEIAAFCDSTGGWLPLLCVMNMTGVTAEVLATFAESGDLDSLSSAAEKVPPGSDGLLLLPYLQGERVPNLPDATGVLSGIRPGLLRSGHLFRAALEGTSLSLALGIEKMQALGVQLDTVRLVGGGSKNPLWCRILADVLEVPVIRVAEPESAALGAVIQAHWTRRLAHGEQASIDAVAARLVQTEGAIFQPDPERAALYREVRERMRTLKERIYS